MGDDAYLREYYGAKYKKVVTERVKVVASMKSDFSKKYPGSDITKFSFLATFDKNASLLEKEVFFIVDANLSIDVESDTFKNNSKMTWYLYQWKRIWSAHGTVQDFKYTDGSLGYELNEFGIYVTDTDRFDSEFPKLVTSWDDPKNTGKDVDVSKLKFDYENNPYFASILAMYLTTYGCGVSIEHLRGSHDTPKIITSIARYHVYYQMRRFLRSPAKMSRYATKDLLKKLSSDIPSRDTLLTKFHQFSDGANINVWHNSQPNRNKIINYRYARNTRGMIAGIYYQLVGGDTKSVYDHDSKDFLHFVASYSNDLTKVGQLLFQQSAESYVYCILGAQAKLRWPIVGRGAKSLQTQEVFRKLVGDTVIQSTQTVTVASMRKAIDDTNVVLNMAISPGVILVPSDMTILTEMVAGYNKTLTLAGSGMKFGENTGVNYDKTPDPKPVVGSGSKQSEVVIPTYEVSVTPSEPPITYKSEMYLLAITTVGGSLISRFLL